MTAIDPVALIGALVAAMGIPSAVMGLIVWRLKGRV